ncbi:anti-sigma factor [Actinocorallia aurantiaca]|uniref:Regulator of SigK n=1 Tax=Actinocorallia aurantiaca TaxID=46204 RepID=A0ABN3TY30_9ACTN
MTAHDTHGLLAPYALDALDDLERRRFEHHLAECASCAEELRGLRETTAMLGLAASSRPPAALRTRVMDEIARTRQLPPGTGARRRWTLPGLPLLLTAAAAMIAVIVFAGYAALQSPAPGPTPPSDPRVSAVLSAADARSVDVEAAGGTGTIVFSRSLNKAVITMSGLPEVPAGRDYELWLIGPRKPRSAGLMREETQVISSVDDATHVGVTIEPEGGSPTPSSAPLFTLALPG